MSSYYQGGAILSSSREQIHKEGPRVPKFPIHCTNEGGEVLELGGAHLHEENLEAFTRERQIRK